ncbi:hypothetical protein [Pseudonocardia sp. TRM90224]|uniref:hypothetical protein n=1 Tax=Pseudonocardia sp. TRM90224 TaxID=2812678 RepID=UPI001E4D58C9|nr:hypothetical protein [Pseudonocardia sp. TRM90224]
MDLMVALVGMAFLFLLALAVAVTVADQRESADRARRELADLRRTRQEECRAATVRCRDCPLRRL